MILQLKKNRNGTPVVYGPLSVLKPGMIVKVEAGVRKLEVTVKSLGKPFKVGGAVMVYGYLTGDGSTSTSRADRKLSPLGPPATDLMP